MKKRAEIQRRRGSFAFLGTLAVILVAQAALTTKALASNPGSGTMLPNSTGLTWVGTAAGTGSADGEGLTCVEGFNCDTYTLNVAGLPTDWTGKMIRIDLNWSLPVDDYDLYVHKNSNDGLLVANSGGGAPSTQEACAIDPSRTGTGIYTVHVVYFTTVSAADQYKGSATIVNRPTDGSRPAIYLKGGMTFSDNQTLYAPATVRDGEPSSRTDLLGNHYVAGIRGVPAGVDFWYLDLNPNSPTYDPYMRNAQYRGQPDSFTQDDAYTVGDDGGGDVDLAVGWQPDGPNNIPTIAFSSLVAANISTAVSKDMGKTWDLNAAGNLSGGAPVDDRQWMEFYGKNVVYMLYRTLEPAITQVQRSNDGGKTWGVAQSAGQIGQVGSLDVDQNDGTVWMTGSLGKVAVGVPLVPGAEPTTYNVYDVVTDPFGVQNIFIVNKVASDGTAYLVYSNGYSVYLKHSKDKGKTWSAPVRVNDGPETFTGVLPTIETGPNPGSVAIAWYGSASGSNALDSEWRVFLAQSQNADSNMPVFRQSVVSDHYIHYGVISVGGTLGSENRNVLDYFQISFDPNGAAVVDYTDDHNDLDGATYVAHQISGPGTNGKKLKKPVEGAALPARQPFSQDGYQVVDFAGDVTKGALILTPDHSDLDITGIKYGSEVDAAGTLWITGTMKVSDLSVITPLSNWRMAFTVNAPHSGISPSGTFSTALSDAGDMFYLRAYTDSKASQAFVWGTVVRNRDGSLTYTQQGAGVGSFDQAKGTVTVKAKASDMTGFIQKGAPIGSGTVLAGLRGMAYSSGTGAIISDDTRGGLEYKVP